MTKLEEMSPAELALLRDGLHAGLVNREQWSALVVGWLDEVDEARPWMIDMLEAPDSEAAAVALAQGWPDLPGEAQGEQVGEIVRPSVLGFIWLRHERGLPLVSALWLAARWTEGSLCDQMEALRWEHEYLERCVREEGLDPACLGGLEEEARKLFAPHLAAAAAWWER